MTIDNAQDLVDAVRTGRVKCTIRIDNDDVNAYDENWELLYNFGEPTEALIEVFSLFGIHAEPV